MATWHTPETARDQWADAPLDDNDLVELLEVAQQAVLAYAPALPEDDVTVEDGYVIPAAQNIPANYRRAQLMQARNIWNASNASTGGEFDGSSYGITTHPLDWQIKQILRPRTVFGGPVG